MALNINTRAVGLEESVGEIVNKINRKGLSVKIRASDYTQPLGRITKSADEFTKSLEASNARVIAFGASAAIIGGVTRGFTELVVQAVKVEKILTDINVVLGTSAANLEKFGKGLFNVARNTSQALDTAAEAALEFSRQGLTMEETLRRTNDALILTRLTGIDAASAVSGLTAAVNGFADAGLSTTSIINKLAAVDVKFAVSAEDLINALARAGAVAQDAGVNFDQLVGAVTAAQQITARGGAVIGNSFKTIFTRIQRSSTLDRLEELGVAVRDIRGNTLPALTVLENLSVSYDKLGASTKAAVAEQVGGVFQINVLKAALKDLRKENSLYAQATDISSRATDQAQQKNAMLQETLSSLATQTSLTLQELSSNIGELALSPGISKILEAVNSFASGLNNLLGEDSEGMGASFAKGIVKGIGNVLTGPGLVLAFGVFAKLFANALKFAKNSLKDVLGIVTAKDKERQIQESIVLAMENNKELAFQLNKFAGDKVKQEEIILGVIKQQTLFLEKQQQIAATLAPALAKRGVSGTLTMPSKSKNSGASASSGFIPESSAQSEKENARKAGYTPGEVKQTRIKGLGDVIYNDAETIKNFKGMSQAAIMPPENSRAGTKYKDKFQESHGFDPYAANGLIPNFIDPRTRAQKIRDTLADPANKNIKFKGIQPKVIRSKNMWDQEILRMYQENPSQKYLGKPLIDYLTQKGYDRQALQSLARNPGDYKIMSEGFVPNFALQAQKVGSILRLPKSKMLAETDASDFRGNRYKGWKEIKTKLKTLKTSAPSYAPYFQALEEMGISHLARSFYFGSQDPEIGKTNKNKTKKGNKKNNKLSTGSGRKSRKTPNQIKGDAKEERLTAPLSKKGYMRTDDKSDAKVDFIAPGRMPYESKAGSLQPDKLMSKSLRLYSDRYIEDFLKESGKLDLAKNLKNQKLQDSLDILDAIWRPNPTEEDVRLMGLSSGFIPNFAKKEPVLNIKSIKDGDSVVAEVAVNPAVIDHRLSEVDAIETKQALGSQATALAQSLYGSSGEKRLERTRVIGGEGSYNRGLFKDKDLSNALVSQGLGVPDLRYTRASKYTSLVKSAQINKAGIWRDDMKDHPKRQMYEHQMGIFSQDPKEEVGKKTSQSIGNKKYTAEELKVYRLLGKDGYARWYDQKNGRGGKTRAENLYNQMTYKGARNRYKTSANGLVPNFRVASTTKSFQLKRSSRLSKDDFNATSGALTDFNSGNAQFARTSLSGASGIKLTARNFEKVRQFLNSKDFRKLDKFLQNKLITQLKSQSKSLGLGDVTRGYGQYFDPMFEGQIAASLGIVPNFVNPLEDAIGRERAAGIPKSMIRVEQDDQLKSSQNPAGLAVTNTRDEPGGVRQGIDRARNMGMDPKTHGASSGLIPNFAKKNQGKTNDDIGQLGDSAVDATGKLFALSSATYLLEGAISDADGAFGKIAQVGTKAVQALVNMQLVGQALQGMPKKMEGMSASLESFAGTIGKGGGILGNLAGGKAGKAVSGGLGMLSRGLSKVGKFLPGLGKLLVLAPAVAEGFEMVTDAFDSSSLLKAAAEKTAKALDSLSNAANANQAVQSVQNSILELNNSTYRDTHKGTVERIKLNNDLRKSQIEFNAALMTMSKTVSFTAEEMEILRGGDTEAKAAIFEKKTAQNLQTQQASQNIGDWLKGSTGTDAGGNDGGKFNFGISNIFQQGLGEIGFGVDTGGAAMKRGKTKEEYLQYQKSFLTQEGRDAVNISTSSMADALQFETKSPEDEKRIRADLSKLEGMSTTDWFGMDSEMEEFAESIKNTNPVVYALAKSMDDANLDAGQISAILTDLIPAYDKQLKAAEDTAGKQEEQASITNELKTRQKAISNALDLQIKAYAMQTSLIKQQQQYDIQGLEHRANVTQSLGFLSESVAIEEQMATQRQRIDNDYNNKLRDANQQSLKAKQQLIKEELKKGSGDENFAMLNRAASSVSGTGSSGAPQNVATTTHKAGSQEAFDINLQALTEKLEAAGEAELAEKMKAARSAEEANTITMEHLSTLKQGEQLEKSLIALQEQNLLQNKDLKETLTTINEQKGLAIEQAEKERGLAEENLSLLQQELEFQAGGLAAAKQKVLRFNEIKDLAGEVKKGMEEAIDTDIENAKITKSVNEEKRKVLSDEVYLAKLVQSKIGIIDEEVTKELESLVNQAARIKAEEENLDLQEKLNETVRQKILNTTGEFKRKTRDANVESAAKFEKNETTGQTFFEGQAELDLTQTNNAARELAQQFLENKKVGLFTAQALLEMGNKARAFQKTIGDMAISLSQGEYEKDAKRDTVTGAVQGMADAQKGAALDKVFTAEDFAGIDGPESAALQRSMVGLTVAQVNAQTQFKNLGTETNNIIKQHQANKEGMVYEAQARKEMADEMAKYQASLINIRERLANNDFGKKALQQITTDGLTAQGETQAIQSKGQIITDEDSPYKGLTGFVGEAQTRIRRLSNATDDLAGQFEANKESGFYQNEAAEGLKQAQIKAKEEAEQFAENLRAGRFEFDAFDEMRKAAEDFTREMIIAKTKLANFEGIREGQREVERNENAAKFDVQRAVGKRNAYREKGAGVRAAEADLEVARARKEMNLELGKEALFRDTITQRIAENNVALERFGETLANTTFDSVEQGFVDLVKDMGDSTMSAGDAFKKMGATILNSINEALTKRAAKQLTNGIFQLFGFGNTGGAEGTGMQKGGLVQGFNNGGSVGGGKVPAMLTNGEYVVRKKIVDRLGSSAMDNMNQSGSLDEMYNQRNEDMFDVMSENAAPSIIQMNSGGHALEKHLLKRSDGGDVSELKLVVGGLVDSVSSLSSGIAHLSEGGFWEKAKKYGSSAWDSLKSSGSDGAWTNIGKGAGTLFGQSMAARERAKKAGDDGAPKAPTKPKQLKMDSALSIDPTGRQMSAQYRQNDTYSQQYGQYLLDKYEYDIQKKNAKTRSNAQALAGLTNSIGLGIVGSEVGKIAEGVSNVWEHREMVGESLGLVEKGTGQQKVLDRWKSEGIESMSDLAEKKAGVVNFQRKAANRTRRKYGKSEYSMDEWVSKFDGQKKSAAPTCSGGVCSINPPSSGSKNSNSKKSSESLADFIKRKEGRVEGGMIGGDIKHFNYGGRVPTTVINNYYNGGAVTHQNGGMQHMSGGGRVFGPGGIDKVGPIMLDKGEYVIKAPSVSKIEKSNPGFFDKLNGMKDGGPVGKPSAQSSSDKPEEKSGGSGSVTININVSSSGETSTSGGGSGEDQAMAGKIKDAVVGVIAGEKRMGGSLSGY